MWFTANGNGEAEVLKIHYRPRPKLKKLSEEFDFASLAIKGRASRGNLVTKKNIISKITLKSKGVSTLSGKRIWFDSDINRLVDSERGLYLGEFSEGDKILVICSDGTYYTTSFDLNNHYQGDIMKIEKLDPEKTVSILYYDGEAKTYYVKRFSFEPNNGIPVRFISEDKKSSFIAISEDKYPQMLVTFTGKNSEREPEAVDVEQYIGKKSFKAMGKKVSYYEVKSVKFIEPLDKDEPEEEQEVSENPAEMPEEAPQAWDNPEEPTLF